MTLDKTNNIKTNISVDIGNSRLKMLIGGEFLSFFHKDNSIKSFQNLIQKHLIEINLLAISSVNQKIENELVNIIENLKLNYLKSNELISKQKIVDCTNISGMGHDRIFGLIGALDFATAPLITIDCGTAITINVLDKNKKVLGGVIFPGPYTQLKALSDNAEALFETNLLSKENLIADNTNDAINNGIIYSIAGGITKIIETIQKENQIPIENVIITGGASELILNALRKFNIKPMHKEYLVLSGIEKTMTEQF
jgi:type III pantothenate kinase